MVKIKGWKNFDKNLCCNGMQFEVGKTYKHDGKIELCKSGFHFHQNETDIFSYYDFNRETRTCEIEATGFILGDDKSVCSEILILKELSWEEVLKIINIGIDNTGRSNSGNWNSGDCNSGYRNSGYSNSGDRNSGDCNSGYRNSGDCNSGYRNSGYRNSGDCNSGYRNSGDWNSGDRNSGDWNSGDWNSGDRNSGLFNTDTSTLRLFNKDSNSNWDDILILNALRHCVPDLNEWVHFSEMTEYEKKQNPKAEVTEGYLKTISYKDGWLKWWGNASNESKLDFLNLPNFDKDIFLEITGINVSKDLKELGLEK